MNPGSAFYFIWDSSARHVCISELMFTLELEPSTIRFKHHLVIHLATESRWLVACASTLRCMYIQLTSSK
ncbi:unnamed protein product [Schistosoma margrebowiei]|uniref:Uncharacterized protein n=1 Tax=Schistosoma margrebowiei TaxID=48269 RepID=A0A3P8A4T8_9TREM|nr:unnamed protein product [Schistosoma margrebowiei]